jgi:hypothetical protein
MTMNDKPYSLASKLEDDAVDLSRIADEQPASVQEAFDRWWDDIGTTAGAMCPTDELVCFVAFAAGFQSAASLSANPHGETVCFVDNQRKP